MPVRPIAIYSHAELIWVSIDWADVQVTLFGDDDAYATIGKESSLITSSHLGDFDWLIGLMLADSHGFLEVRHDMKIMLPPCNKVSFAEKKPVVFVKIYTWLNNLFCSLLNACSMS